MSPSNSSAGTAGAIPARARVAHAPAGAPVAAANHGSARSLAAGFVLSLVLTVIPFAMVMTGAAPRGMVLPALIASAMLQVAVHVTLFLHLDTKSEGGWNALAFGVTALITVIVLAGSVWIMSNLDRNMAMPMPMETPTQMPMQMQMPAPVHGADD